MKKKYFNLFCIILILFLDNCNTTIITQIPTSEGKLCIYPERKNGTLPESQKQFHFVYLKSGDIRIQFDKQEEDCYYFTRLPVGKVFQLDSVGNLNISEYWFKWKNDGKLSRGVYGKYNPSISDKLEIKTDQLNFFGNYKLSVDYSEEKKENQDGWNVSGGRNTTSAVIREALYEIIKIE